MSLAQGQQTESKLECYRQHAEKRPREIIVIPIRAKVTESYKTDYFKR
jgi:hypothetical protein